MQGAVAGGSLYVTFSDGVGPNGITAGAVLKLDIAADTWTDITPGPHNVTGGFMALATDDHGLVAVATSNRWQPISVPPPATTATIAGLACGACLPRHDRSRTGLMPLRSTHSTSPQARSTAALIAGIASGACKAAVCRRTCWRTNRGTGNSPGHCSRRLRSDDAHEYGRRYRILEGDPRHFGRVYVGTDGRGIVMGEPKTVAASDP